MMTTKGLAASAMGLALAWVSVQSPTPRQFCGIFNAEFVRVVFTVTGGGSYPHAGGVTTVKDDFSGAIHLSRHQPDDECAASVEVQPYHLTHSESWRGSAVGSSDLQQGGSISHPQATIVFGINPISGTWNLVPLGFFPVTETSTDAGGQVTQTNVPELPWALEGNALVPNLPIPTGTSAQITREIQHPVIPTLRWTVTINVHATHRPNIDPCYLYGSSIGCEDQSLGESVPITGIPFRLHYRSDRFLPEAGAKGWSPRVLAVAGWSLAIHHSWDPAGETLYQGDGSTRRWPPLKPVTDPSLGPRDAILIPRESGTEAFLFDATGRHLKTFDAVTGQLRYAFSYLPSGALTVIRDAFGHEVKIEREAGGGPVALVAPSGDRTTLTSGPEGLLSSVVNNAGDSYRFEYAPGGRLAVLTDPLNQVHRYSYDVEGRLIRDQSPDGSASTLTRMTQSPTVGVRFAAADGAATVFESSRSGNRRTVRFPDGSVTFADISGGEDQVTMRDGSRFVVGKAQDPVWGRIGPPESIEFFTPQGISRSVSTTVNATLTAQTNPIVLASRDVEAAIDGKTFRSAYLADSRTFSITTPLGRTSSVQYDTKGLPATFSRGGLASIRLTHDAQGRVSEARSGNGEEERRIRFDYDSKGRLSAIVDALGRVRRFGYDALNRVVEQGLAGNETRYRYDALGRPTMYQPPGRPEHRVFYAASGRVSAYQPPATTGTATRVGYGYNAAGMLTSFTRLDGSSVTLTRNAAGVTTSAATSKGVLRTTMDARTGQLAEAVSPSGVIARYAYDGPLLTGIAYSGAVTGGVTMHYGASARLETVAVPGGPEYTYKYDDDGLLVGAGDQVFTRDPQSGLLTTASLGDMKAEWKYNSFGEPIEHVERFNDRELYQATYLRDALGRIVKRSETVAGTALVEEYQYDANGRLARVVRNGTESGRYEYDANGNRTRAVYPTATLTATYDDQDRLLTFGDATFSYTGHGELRSRTDGGGVMAFGFDELGELRSARTPSGRAIEYLADADGRRVGRRVGGQLQESLVYDGDGAPVAWFGPAGALRAFFIFGRRSHVPEAMLRNGVSFRFVTDQVGSVRLVVNAATGEVAQRLDYDPFGRILRDTKPGFQPFGFAGGLLDGDTGLLRFGLRDYDPETGRWTSKDPLYFGSGSTNFYEYVANDPVNSTDPSGLWGVEVSFGVGSVGVSYESGVGLSGSVSIGRNAPGATYNPAGRAYVPADVETADFWSRDTKVTVEGKVSAGFGSWASIAGIVSLEQQADRYGIRCGPWKPTAKAELCVLGACMDTDGEMKSDFVHAHEIAQEASGKKPGEKGKFGTSAEAVVKIEALIWSAR